MTLCDVIKGQVPELSILKPSLKSGASKKVNTGVYWSSLEECILVLESMNFFLKLEL